MDIIFVLPGPRAPFSLDYPVSTHDNTIYLNSRLHWAEDMAAQVMRLPFEQTRFNYLVNWYPKGAARYGKWKDAAEPDLDDFITIFSSFIELREGDAEAHALPDERQRAYIESAKAGVAAAKHPYEKVGALLAVFKQYRAEVASVSTRKVRTEHNALRNHMTELLHQYSRAELRQEKGPIAPDGYTKLLRGLSQHSDVSQYLALEPAHKEWRPTMASLLDYDSQIMSVWKGREDAYMSRSSALGRALNSLPSGSLFLVHGPSMARFRNLTETPRRPDFWFVISHYLATHSEATWSREFVADAILRNVSTMNEPEPANDGSLAAVTSIFGEDKNAFKRVPLPVYAAKLQPLLAEDEYNAQWWIAEKPAWRDYRQLRQLMLEEDPQRTLNAISPPCKSDRIHALRYTPESVFNTTWRAPITPETSKKLLDVAVPGLGDRYQMILDVDTALALNEGSKKAMLLEALSEMNASLKLEPIDLPVDLSL